MCTPVERDRVSWTDCASMWMPGYSGAAFEVKCEGPRLGVPQRKPGFHSDHARIRILNLDNRQSRNFCQFQFKHLNRPLYDLTKNPAADAAQATCHIAAHTQRALSAAPLEVVPSSQPMQPPVEHARGFVAEPGLVL